MAQEATFRIYEQLAKHLVAPSQRRVAHVVLGEEMNGTLQSSFFLGKTPCIVPSTSCCILFILFEMQALLLEYYYGIRALLSPKWQYNIAGVRPWNFVEDSGKSASLCLHNNQGVEIVV